MNICLHTHLCCVTEAPDACEGVPSGPQCKIDSMAQKSLGMTNTQRVTVFQMASLSWQVEGLDLPELKSETWTETFLVTTLHRGSRPSTSNSPLTHICLERMQ